MALIPGLILRHFLGDVTEGSHGTTHILSAVQRQAHPDGRS